MLKRYLAALICIILICGLLSTPVFAEVKKERVYFIREFDSADELETLKTSNCCTPTISASDDGCSVLRIENTVETNMNASGFFYLGGGTKTSYIEIPDSPVLVFEYKVRMAASCNNSDYFTTAFTNSVQSELTACINKTNLLAKANTSNVLTTLDRTAWNTITTVFSNTDGSRKVYLNGKLVADINKDHAYYEASGYSRSGFSTFKPHFIAYMKALGDYCEIDYVKLYSMADSIHAEKVNIYDKRNEIYVDFDSTLLNVKPENFSLSGNEILKAEKYDMEENIVKLTLKNPLADYEKYQLRINGVENIGGAICNETISFTSTFISASSPKFFQDGAEIEAYDYSEKPVSISSTVKNSHEDSVSATLYFNAYGEVNGEKTLLLSKSESFRVPGKQEMEIKVTDISLTSGITEIKAFVWKDVMPISSVATISKKGYTSKASGIPDFGKETDLGNVSYAKKAGAASTGLTKLGYRTYIAMVGTPGYVYEFDTYTGEFLSAFESGSGLQHAIKVGSDGKVYTMITSSPDLYVYDPETRENKLIQADCCQGSQAWSMTYGANDDRSMLYMPVMSSNYQTLGTSVVEYDIDNGVVKSYDGFDIGCKYAHVATGDDEYIYVGSADGVEVATISRMDKKTGEIATYENDTSVSPGSVTFIKVIGDFIFARFYSHIIVLNRHTMKRIDTFSGGRSQRDCISEPDPSNPNVVYYNTNDGKSLLSYNMKTYQRTFIMSTPTTYGNFLRWDFGRWIPDKDGNLGLAGIGGTEDNPGLFHIIPSEGKFNHIYTDYEGNNGVPTQASYFYLTRDDILYVGGYEAGLNGFDMKTKTTLFSVSNGNQHGMTMVGGKLFGGVYGKDGIYMYDPAKPVSGSNPKLVSPSVGVNRYYNTSDTNAGFGLSVGIADYGNPEGGVILMTYLNNSPKVKYYIGVIPGENIVGVAYKDGYIYASSSVKVPLFEDVQHEEAHVAKIDAKTGETVLMKTVNFNGLPKTTKIGEIRFGPDGLLYGKANAGQTIFALNPDDLSLVKYKSYYPTVTPAASYASEGIRFGDEGNLYAILNNTLHCINIETMESEVVWGKCGYFHIDNDGNILKRSGRNSNGITLGSVEVNYRQRFETMIKNARKYYKEEEFSKESWANFQSALGEAEKLDIKEAYLPDIKLAARNLGFAIRDLQTVYDYNAGYAFPFK